MIHTVKGFSIVSETEVDVFLEFPCFLYDSANVGNLIPSSLPFLNLAWTSGSSQFMSCSLWFSMQDFEHHLQSWEMNAIVWWLEHFLVIALLGNWNED